MSFADPVQREFPHVCPPVGGGTLCSICWFVRWKWRGRLLCEWQTRLAEGKKL